MNVNYYSIYDKKSEVYSPCFPAPTHGSAERAIQEQVRNPETQLAKWPADFCLYFMFVIDDHSGAISIEESVPMMLVEVSQLVES